MSDQLPIRVSPSPVPSSNKAPVTAPNDDVSADKQSEFGNVLSNQVQQKDVQKTKSVANDAVSNTEATTKTTDKVLPQDGKVLPVSPELLTSTASEGEAELAISGLITPDDSGEEVELAPEDAEAVALAAPVIIVDSTPVTATTPVVNSEKASSRAVTQSATATSIIPAATVTGEAADDSAQAQAVSQQRQIASLEGNVISLVSRGEVEKSAFQSDKIIEQFTDVNTKQVSQANPVSAPVSTLSPVITSSSATTSATGLQQVSIEVPVQHQQWQRAFAERVVWSVGNNQSVQIRLNPAELGPIDIQLNMTKDQANIMFHASHALTRETIESSIPKLREMLANEGLFLGDVDVRQHDSSARDQAASQEQNNNSGRNGGFANRDELADGQGDILLHPVVMSERVVDYYI